MPYPNEHSSRQNDPGKYTKIRRENNKFGQGIDVIWGVLENGDTEVQAIRFDASKFTPEESRAWLKDHDFKTTLEPASGEAQAMEQIMESMQLSETEIMLFPRGTFLHPEYGQLVFDDAFFDSMIANFDQKVLKIDPFIDQDHDEGQAAGWIKKLVKKASGLYAIPEWTSLGKKLIADKIYRYFSPWWGEYKDEQTGELYTNVLRGGGLTNVPFLKAMPAVQLSESKEGRDKGKRIEIKDLKLMQIDPSDVMDMANLMSCISGLMVRTQDKELSAKLQAMHNMLMAHTNKPETAMSTEPAKTAAEPAAKQKEDHKMSEKILKALGVDSEEKALTEIQKLKDGQARSEAGWVSAAEHEKTKSRVAELEKMNAEVIADGLIEKAMLDGKLSPAEKDTMKKLALKDMATFREILASRPPMSYLKEMGAGYDGSANEGEAVINRAAELRKADPKMSVADSIKKASAELNYQGV